MTPTTPQQPESKTPRSDNHWNGNHSCKADLNFARQLEKELKGAINDLADVSKQLATALQGRDEARGIQEAVEEVNKDALFSILTLEQDRDNWRLMAEKCYPFIAHLKSCKSKMPDELRDACTCGLTALRAELQTLKTAAEKGK